MQGITQWRSQDFILGGGKKITCEGAKRPSPSERSERGGGGGGGGRGVFPGSHSESFLHFDVVNGAIWCMFLACFIDLKQSSWFR